MKALLLSFGATIVVTIRNLLSSTVGRAVIGTSLFLLLLTLLPFNIGLPQEIMDVLQSDFLKNLFVSMTFLFPVSFALKCLAVLLMSNHFSFIFRIIKNVFNVLVGGGNNGD